MITVWTSLIASALGLVVIGLWLSTDWKRQDAQREADELREQLRAARAANAQLLEIAKAHGIVVHPTLRRNAYLSRRA